MRRLLGFVADKKMLSLTGVSATGVSATGVSATAGGGAGGCVSDGDDGVCQLDGLPETLHPSSRASKAYTTLGSDFSCDYIDSFFRRGGWLGRVVSYMYALPAISTRLAMIDELVRVR